MLQTTAWARAGDRVASPAGEKGTVRRIIPAAPVSQAEVEWDSGATGHHALTTLRAVPRRYLVRLYGITSKARHFYELSVAARNYPMAQTEATAQVARDMHARGLSLIGWRIESTEEIEA